MSEDPHQRSRILLTTNIVLVHQNDLRRDSDPDKIVFSVKVPFILRSGALMYYLHEFYMEIPHKQTHCKNVYHTKSEWAPYKFFLNWFELNPGFDIPE